jgi:hypothetical protein
MITLREFLKRNWPVLGCLFILIFEIMTLVLKEFFLGYLHAIILIVFAIATPILLVVQLRIWFLKKSRLGLRQLPIFLFFCAWSLLTLNIDNVYGSLVSGGGNWGWLIYIIPLTFFATIIQLIYWILFYIDWPVSRYIKRNIESMWKCIKKGIERHKTKENRRRFLNIVYSVCIILVVVGVIKIKGYLDDQKELGRSKIYQLPIKVIGIHPMPKGLYIDYEVRDSVTLASGEDSDEVMYVTFKQTSSNIIMFEKAHLRRPETNNYIKVNVKPFAYWLDHDNEIEFDLDTKKYFVNEEKLKKIDPKILSMQNIPSINYLMIRVYKGYHKVEKIKFGEVEI